jgi:hypothetical protein
MTNSEEFTRTEFIQQVHETLLMCGQSDLHAISVLTGFSIAELEDLGGLDR